MFRDATRAIQTFGNAGCRFDNVNEVPLNRFERANVATIQSVEKGHALSALKVASIRLQADPTN